MVCLILVGCVDHSTPPVSRGFIAGGFRFGIDAHGICSDSETSSNTENENEYDSSEHSEGILKHKCYSRCPRCTGASHACEH